MNPSRIPARRILNGASICERLWGDIFTFLDLLAPSSLATLEKLSSNYSRKIGKVEILPYPFHLPSSAESVLPHSDFF